MPALDLRIVASMSRARPAPTRLSINKPQAIKLLLHCYKGYFGNSRMLHSGHDFC